MEIETVNKISKFLNIKIGRPTIDKDLTLRLIVNGHEYVGLASVILKLIEVSKEQHWANKHQECAVYQWLEFASINVSQFNINTPQGKSILKDLNSYLENCSYLVGYSRTIADIIVYYFIYNTILSMGPSDKETYVNLCRWFDHLQYDEAVRQNNKLVNFSSNYIATRVSVQN